MNELWRFSFQKADLSGIGNDTLVFTRKIIKSRSMLKGARFGTLLFHGHYESAVYEALCWRGCFILSRAV